MTSVAPPAPRGGVAGTGAVVAGGAGADKKGEVNELRMVRSGGCVCPPATPIPTRTCAHTHTCAHTCAHTARTCAHAVQLLRAVNTERDSKRKRDVIKKVIAYMTLGIDVSRLFSDMVLACNTKDLVVKKMVYLYLCAYAQSNAELTLLAINTLQKDCRDEDPMVRGLALRSLTGLRLISILEYVMSPLKAGLTDSSGYVRQTAVIGVLKVFHLSPGLVKDGDFVDTLYAMMRDREPQVVINCVSALNEILAEEGGIAINQPMIHYLLGRIKEFNDWGQCIVMELTTKYTAANEVRRRRRRRRRACARAHTHTTTNPQLHPPTRNPVPARRMSCLAS